MNSIKFNNKSELVKYYNSFKDLSLTDLYSIVSEKFGIKISTNKGVVGQVLEGLIGNKPNSNPNVDVSNLGVELKVLPLRKVYNRLQPKERSKIKSLNYNEILKEEWVSSAVRKKISSILFLLYEQPIGFSYKDWNNKDFQFKGCLFYELENQDEDIVHEDWRNIQLKVKKHRAHLISESDSLILGACTSGTGKEQVYGNGSLAKQRSYSLKHSYLKQFYLNSQGVKYSTLTTAKSIKPEDYIINKLKSSLKGIDLKTLSDEYNVQFSSSAKSSISLLIKRIFKVDDDSRIKEIDLLNIEIKTVPVNDGLKPWESMSFPKFSLHEILDENWENNNDENEFDNESTFRSYVDRPFIFIPVIKNKFKKDSKYKFENWQNWRVGRPVYWRPSKEQLEAIKIEWEMAKKIINSGVKVSNVKYGRGYRQENNLLKASNTNYIHIRPHARDANDLDKPFKEKTGIEICWQSFWFNKIFINKIIK